MTNVLLISGPTMPNINSYLGNITNQSSVIYSQLNFTYDPSSSLPIIIGTIQTTPSIQNTITQFDYTGYFPTLTQADYDSLTTLFPTYSTILSVPINIIYNNIKYMVSNVMYLGSNIIMLMVPV
jgi:hypothetical protein